MYVSITALASLGKVKITIKQHVQDKLMIWDSQHSFTDDKLCQNNMVAFYEGRQNDVIYLTFCKVHSTAPQNTLISKLEMDMGVKGGLLRG